MGEQIGDRLIRQVVASTIGTCSSCARSLDEWAVTVLGHEEDLWFCSITCCECHTRLLAAALVRDSQPITLGDFKASTTPAIDRSTVVDAEDIQSIRLFLDSFDGDFRALFG